MSIKQIIFSVSALIIIVTMSSSTVSAFDLPNTDPWFYQSTEAGYNFWVPDKVQHYYGSMLVNETFKRFSLPAEKVTVPILALTAGFVWEVYQERQGLGFSERDLMADALGVLSSNFSSKSTRMWIDYSTRDKVITFNISRFIG